MADGEFRYFRSPRRYSKLAPMGVKVNTGDGVALAKQLGHRRKELSAEGIIRELPRLTAELEERTPPWITWQDQDWPAHCGESAPAVGLRLSCPWRPKGSPKVRELLPHQPTTVMPRARSVAQRATRLAPPDISPALRNIEIGSLLTGEVTPLEETNGSCCSYSPVKSKTYEHADMGWCQSKAT